jgi:nucleotidyltransferase AbiEii toxin of type IV toxin-antitoxin system
MFSANLSILPEPQRRLWAELRDTPKTFVLYGGTALALRLGHRQSEDFDSFSNKPFRPAELREGIPYLKHAEMTQFQDNPLTALVDRNGPVKLSFFGSLGIKHVQDPDIVEKNGISDCFDAGSSCVQAENRSDEGRGEGLYGYCGLVRRGLDPSERVGGRRRDPGLDGIWVPDAWLCAQYRKWRGRSAA